MKSKVPAYYEGRSGVPACPSAGACGYLRGCAWKYIVRAGRKTEDPTVDLRKAIHCLEKEIEVWESRCAEKAANPTR